MTALESLESDRRSLALTLMSLSVVSVAKSLSELIYNSMSTIHKLPSPCLVLDHLSSLAPETRLVLSMSKINAVQQQVTGRNHELIILGLTETSLSSIHNRFLSLILRAP